MVYNLTYKKASAKRQTFTLLVNPKSIEPRVSVEGNEYIVAFVEERQACRSLRIDRIVSVEKVAKANEKLALAKARKAYSNYKRTRG